MSADQDTTQRYSLATNHAFLLVGRDADLLLTHLPMLHRKSHGHHLVVSASLPLDAAAEFLDSQELHPKTPFWIANSPDDPIEIQDIVDGARKTFHVDMWRGIPDVREYTDWPWEGVTPLVAGARLSVHDVLYHHPFDENETRPDHLEYILLGDERVACLHHRMVAQPDFDHVVRLKSVPKGFGEHGPDAMVVRFPDVRSPHGTPCSSPLAHGHHRVGGDRNGEHHAYVVEIDDTLWFSTKRLIPNLIDPC